MTSNMPYRQPSGYPYPTPEYGTGFVTYTLDGVPQTFKVGQNSMKYLITGAGTLGTALIEALIDMNGAEYNAMEIRVLDFSEDALWRIEERFPKVKCLLGDIRDADRVRRAVTGVDTIIHTAALKHVRYTNYAPMECFKTNVMGTEHLLQAAVDEGVGTFCNISSDKACAPTNVYGESKRMTEFLTQAAFERTGNRYFSCRFGNFIGSHGSVIERWKVQKESGTINLTDKRMTRFFIKPRAVADYILRQCISPFAFGTVCVPYMQAYNMGIMSTVVAKHYGVDVKHIGAFSGERLDEVVISHAEGKKTMHTSDGWVYYGVGALPEGKTPINNAVATNNMGQANETETEKILDGLL